MDKDVNHDEVYILLDFVWSGNAWYFQFCGDMWRKAYRARFIVCTMTFVRLYLIRSLVQLEILDDNTLAIDFLMVDITCRGTIESILQQEYTK